MSIENDVEGYVNIFKEYLAEKAAKIEAANAAAAEEMERRRAIAEERQQAEAEFDRRRKAINDRYEYAFETVMDRQDGSTEMPKVRSTINAYAAEGWRLHSIYTNELGKNQHHQVLSIGTINATIEETILVFGTGSVRPTAPNRPARFRQAGSFFCHFSSP